MDAEVKLTHRIVLLLLILVHYSVTNEGFVESKKQLPDWYQRIKKVMQSEKVKYSSKCPEKCICLNEESAVVRCMFLRWRKIPKVHENTQKL